MTNFGYSTETAPPELRDAYKALEPDPNADYGTILPFAIDRTTGKGRWAMPSLLRDTLDGGLDLLAGLDTGEVTPRAALQLGIENPEVANLFARLRASNQVAGEEAPNVLPLFGRYVKKGDIDLNKVEYPQAVTSIAEAFDKYGFDAARVLNYHANLPGSPPIAGQTAWVFKSPNQLRSVHAAFDPAKRESSDLMAGFAAPGPAPGFRVKQPEPAKDDLRSWPGGLPYRFLQREQVY